MHAVSPRQALFSCALSAAAVFSLSHSSGAQPALKPQQPASPTGEAPVLTARDFADYRAKAPAARPAPAAPRISDDTEQAVLIQPARPKSSQAPSQAPQPARTAAAAPSPSYTDLPSASGAYGSAKAYAEAQVGAAQFPCLESLWDRESGWNAEASNPGSGAYGIPQALPGSKMASAGADWATNPITQVKWGLGYIQQVYGNPCSAWDHEEAAGWY